MQLCGEPSVRPLYSLFDKQQVAEHFHAPPADNVGPIARNYNVAPVGATGSKVRLDRQPYAMADAEFAGADL
jgi:hypothetical protein